jgi:hypothetical protein
LTAALPGCNRWWCFGVKRGAPANTQGPATCTPLPHQLAAGLCYTAAVWCVWWWGRGQRRVEEMGGPTCDSGVSLHVWATRNKPRYMPGRNGPAFGEASKQRHERDGGARAAMCAAGGRGVKARLRRANAKGAGLGAFRVKLQGRWGVQEGGTPAQRDGRGVKACGGMRRAGAAARAAAAPGVIPGHNKPRALQMAGLWRCSISQPDGLAPGLPGVFTSCTGQGPARTLHRPASLTALGWRGSCSHGALLAHSKPDYRGRTGQGQQPSLGCPGSAVGPERMHVVG